MVHLLHFVTEKFAYLKKKLYLCIQKRIIDYTKSCYNCVFYYTN